MKKSLDMMVQMGVLGGLGVYQEPPRNFLLLLF